MDRWMQINEMKWKWNVAGHNSSRWFYMSIIFTQVCIVVKKHLLPLSCPPICPFVSTWLPQGRFRWNLISMAIYVRGTYRQTQLFYWLIIGRFTTTLWNLTLRTCKENIMSVYLRPRPSITIWKAIKNLGQSKCKVTMSIMYDFNSTWTDKKILWKGIPIGVVPIVAVFQFVRSKHHRKFCLLTDLI